MGEARNRGTRAQRVAQAIERSAAAAERQAAEAKQRQIDALSISMVLGVRQQRAQQYVATGAMKR